MAPDKRDCKHHKSDGILRTSTELNDQRETTRRGLKSRREHIQGFYVLESSMKKCQRSQDKVKQIQKPEFKGIASTSSEKALIC